MDLRNSNELIRNRKSVFPAEYNDKPVSKEFIHVLLENANCAPTHRRTEPWRFKVVMDEAKDRLGTFLADTYTDITTNEDFSPFKYKKIADNCSAAGAIIVVCMQRDLKERVPEWEEIAATAMSVQNMWLTCTDYGFGCYWSTPKLLTYMGDFFEFNEGERCLGFFYIGNYDADNNSVKVKRTSVADKVEWVK